MLAWRYFIRFVLLVFTAAHSSLTADLVAFLVVHVCATAHLTKIGVLEFCLGGPASELGLGGKTGSFLVCGREYSGEYVSTSTSTYVRSQRTAVFWAVPSSRLKGRLLWIMLTLVRIDDSVR